VDFDLNFKPRSPGREKQQTTATAELTLHKRMVGAGHAEVKLFAKGLFASMLGRSARVRRGHRHRSQLKNLPADKDPEVC
jgi:hypothetical protein